MIESKIFEYFNHLVWLNLKSLFWVECDIDFDWALGAVSPRVTLNSCVDYACLCQVIC